ncbi:MAG: TIR domain-containing protein [Solobacterium sp.]|nr:TIR domain-containing protein [Solobacterium sp.]
MAADIFISYKSDEEEYAKRVRDVLEQNGISCWMAPDSIPVGSNYMKQIPQAIENCKAMIVLVSEKSQHSTWVKNEFSQAVSKDKLVIPYVIQDCPLEDEFAFSMSTMQQVFAWKDEEAALQRIVRDIREVLGQDSTARVEIKVVKKNNNVPWIIAGVAVIALLAGVLAFVFARKPAEPQAQAAAQAAAVYYSEVLPFYETGSYTTVQSAQESESALPEYDRAFSLLSFIKNPSEEPVFVEKIACEIEDVTPVQTPVIRTDGMLLEDDTLVAFAYNDGWGKAETVNAEWHAEPEDGIPSFPAFEEQLKGSASVSVEGGSAAELLRMTVDFTELLEWARQQDMRYMEVLYYFFVDCTCEGKSSGFTLFFMYDPDTDSIVPDYGGNEDEYPSITLYAMLDVDNPPSELRFVTGDNTPLVDDTYRIETVIIPTKSCEVTCRGSYSIGGEPYETEDYHVNVKVPCFQKWALEMGGPLTMELAHTDMSSPAMVERACAKYQYNPESILPGQG